MRWHASNENKKRGGRKGSILRHGRAWLHWGKGSRHNMGFEWSFGWKSFGLELEAATNDHALAASAQLFFVALYWHLEHMRLYYWLEQKTKRKDEKYGNGRQIGLRFYQEYIWLDLWNDPMESRSVDPRWWHVSVNWKDVLLGRVTHEEMQLRRERLEVPMPEACYPVEVEFTEARWMRPRWFTKRVLRAHITAVTPIPFPGKGENSWDCGEDATHSLTCPAVTDLDAVTAMFHTDMRSRLRHGGKSWRPASAEKVAQ